MTTHELRSRAGGQARRARSRFAVRGGLAVPFVLLSALVLALHDAEAVTESVRVRVAPSTVRAGKTLVVAASVSPAHARCRPTLKSPTGATRSLPATKARGSEARWTWLVPKAATPGRWTATVACAGAGRASGRFTVLPPPPPPVVAAKLEIEKYGYAVESLYSIAVLGYGAVIRNVSPDEDAIGVAVLVNVIGSDGRILKSDSDSFEAIPAGTTYYAAGEILFDTLSPQVARIEVSVSFDEGAKKSVVLPPVSNIRVQEGFLGTQVAGEIGNPYSKPLSDLARITAVVFDASGNVIGGGYDWPAAAVPPGGRIGFEVDVMGRTVSEIGSAQVSVEPEVE